MQEVGSMFGKGCRYFSLRGAGLPGEEPFDMAPELEGDETRKSVLIFDDIDSIYPVDLPSASQLLETVSDGPVFMTARREEVWFEWERLAPITDKMRLGGLSQAEVAELLRAAEVPDAFANIAAFGQEQVPAALLGYVDALGWAREGGMLETILTPDGEPQRDPGSLSKVEFSVREVDDLLISELATRPELMHQLSPRKFEEFVAELYSRSGFEVELTRPSKDGGVDIYAVQRAPFGSFLTVVDCKRHRADRPIQVGLVRGLYGTVMETGASAGAIATTSYFTKGAKAFQDERKHRIGLQDFVSLRQMLFKTTESDGR
jgi:restriction system protein